MTQTVLAAPAKRDVLEEIGEPTLLLPALINSGLAANDRAKYLLSLFQAARARADAPAEPFASLRAERLAAGIAALDLDNVVAGSRQVSQGVYVIPQARRIHQDLTQAVSEMLEPLAAAGPMEAQPREGQPPDKPGEAWSSAHNAAGPARLAALLAAAPDLAGDQVAGSYIDAMASADRAAGDSLHLLVMDAHRDLNRLQAQVATETLSGAAVYGLASEDRSLVAAFMAGLEETAPLKFSHPGLATTATRIGSRLVIQNDLGTTSAHVFVISVEGLTATITCTDVHPRRLRFFASLLDRFDVQWSDTETRERGPVLGRHHLLTGRLAAESRSALAAYLAYVGSRLVFVLDWNRARKRLMSYLSQADAVGVLRWAADSNVGHMAFLMLGGERLVYEAVEQAAPVPARYGEPLTELLGQDETLAVTRFALRAAAEGMLAGQSHLLIKDKLRVEVLRHAQASERGLLDATAEHAALIVETAQALQAALARRGADEETAGYLGRAARRAAGWEHRADEIVVAQRRAARRVAGANVVAELTAAADDAIDDLEEAVFMLTLLPPESAGQLRPVLLPVASIAATAAREHLKVTRIAGDMVDGPAAEDFEDFLVAVDRVATLEHDADDADRAARAALVSTAPEFRSLYVADSISRGAESATDALLRSALGLRDHILSSLSAR